MIRSLTFIALSTAPLQAGDARPPPDMQTLTAYMFCDAASSVRALDRAEVRACAAVYTRLKMSFLADVSVADLNRMTPGGRAEANRRSYMAYRAWADENAVLIAQLRAQVIRRLASDPMR